MRVTAPVTHPMTKDRLGIHLSLLRFCFGFGVVEIVEIHFDWLFGARFLVLSGFGFVSAIEMSFICVQRGCHGLILSNG